MGFKDMREWIDKLETEGELKRVTAKVDWNLELGEVARRSLALKGPAILFENIKDYENTRCRRMLVNGISRHSRIAMMLGVSRKTPPQELMQVVRKRFKEPVPPVGVKTGPVKENIVTGDDIDLYQFPVPQWHPMDGGRYIDTWCGVVTRDPDTRNLNVGLYRGMIQTKNKIGKSNSSRTDS